MKKKQRPTDGGGNWMDTYGDMVTLLLCFFVMLYSMSNLNEQKWEVFVRSIFPDASKEKVDDVAVNAPEGEKEEELEGSAEVPEEMAEVDTDTLYLTLAQKLNELGIEGVTLSRGEDYTFIVFENKTFFDGDQSVLTKEGETVLDVFCDVIAPANELLSQIDIMGYTSQGDPDRPNNPRTDRMLSAERAAEVCIFIQGRDVIDPEKLVSISYGQFRPVDTFETAEGRARNRRVELLMLDEGADVRSLNEYYEEFRSGVNDDKTIITDGLKAGDVFQETDTSSEGVSTQVEMDPDRGSEGEGAEAPAEPDGTATESGEIPDAEAEPDGAATESGESPDAEAEPPEDAAVPEETPSDAEAPDAGTSGPEAE